MHPQTLVLRVLCALLVCAFLASAVLAQDTLLVNYQGRLTDDNGDPITGTPSMTFVIYDGSGPLAESKWSETHPTVQVEDGLFDVILGSGTALPDSVFNSDERYIGITIGGDPEISPRTQLVSVPYAYHAKTADPSTPIMWSGGCTSHGTSEGWNTYCTNGVDFSNVDGYLSVSPEGTFTVLTAGYYRINTWAATLCTSSRNVMIRRNGSTIHGDIQTNTGSGWRTLGADLTWHFDAGDTFEVLYYNDGGGYAFHAWNSSGQHSRLQVTFVGP